MQQSISGEKHFTWEHETENRKKQNKTKQNKQNKTKHFFMKYSIWQQCRVQPLLSCYSKYSLTFNLKIPQGQSSPPGSTEEAVLYNSSHDFTSLPPVPLLGCGSLNLKLESVLCVHLLLLGPFPALFCCFRTPVRTRSLSSGWIQRRLECLMW